MAKQLTLTWNSCVLKVKDSAHDVNYAIIPVAWEASKRNQSITLTARGGLKKVIFLENTTYSNLTELIDFIDGSMCNT